MKKILMKAIPAMMFMSLNLFADTTTVITVIEEKKDPEFFEYHNRVSLFAPFHQSYERIKPRSFYAGVDAYIASNLLASHDQTVLNGEVRMGHNFFWNGRDHFTPCAGVGFFSTLYKHSDTLHYEDGNWYYHDNDWHYNPGVLYGLVGFLYDHEFNSIFNLGLRAKLLVGGSVGKKGYWGNTVVGADVSLPITFRFGHKRHWDWRIEPFNTYLNSSLHCEDYLGFRGTLAYRF